MHQIPAPINLANEKIYTPKLPLQPLHVPNQNIHKFLQGKFGKLESFIFQCFEEYSAISITEEQLVFGHFDCQGCNMAFNVNTSSLDGIFDFSDVSIHDFHKNLYRLNCIPFDLMQRVCKLYQDKTGRFVDIKRINLYSMVSRIFRYVRAISYNAPPEDIKLCHKKVIEWANLLIKYETLSKEEHPIKRANLFAETTKLPVLVPSLLELGLFAIMQQKTNLDKEKIKILPEHLAKLIQ